MDNIKRYKTFFNNLAVSIALVSVLLVAIQLIWRVYDNSGGLAVDLLRIYLYFLISQFLNYEILPKFINIRKTALRFYVTQVIEFSVIFTLIYVISEYIRGREMNIIIAIIFTGSLFISISIVYTIVYFLEKAHYKRVNQKLDEYKQREEEYDEEF